jgi:hypothetical protein
MSFALRPSTVERLIREGAVLHGACIPPFVQDCSRVRVAGLLRLTSLACDRYVEDVDDGAWINDLVAALRVSPGTTVTLPEDLAPTYKPDFIAKRDRTALLSESVQLLAAYQTRLAAQGTHLCCCACRGSTAPGRTAPSATS